MHLDVKQYDPHLDQIEIEGIVYSGELFRMMGVFGMAEGEQFEVVERKDGVLTIRALKKT